MAEDISDTPYVAEVERDDAGNWIASVPAMRGVHTHARTLAGLRRYLQDAIALWLEVGRVDAGERDPHIDRDTVKVELRLELPAHVRRAAELRAGGASAHKPQNMMPLQLRERRRKRS